MKPALELLYSLAVVEGALFFYRASYASAAKGLVKLVAEEYEFKDREDLVWAYLRETKTGCQKNPSFARGRNLITYAVNQMDSMSLDKYISGVRILGTIIKRKGIHISVPYQREIIEQHVLIKHLLMGSASSGHLLHNLLRTLDSRSPYDMETRESAVRIVEHIAGGVRLKQFPGGIQCIASLLDTYEGCQLIEPYKRDWLLERAYELDCPIDSYKELWPVNSEPPCRRRYKGWVLKGLRIIGKLAAAEQENCRVISNTQGLLSRIMAAVTLDLLHNSDHHLWDGIVDESLKVMKQLMTAPGETGKKLRRQIASNTEVIISMENILKCGNCYLFQKKLAMGILGQLCIDTSVSMDTESKRNYVNTLLCIFFASAKDSRTRELAGEKLATIASISRSNAMVILSANDDVLDNLIAILLQGARRNTLLSANRRTYTGWS